MQKPKKQTPKSTHTPRQKKKQQTIHTKTTHTHTKKIQNKTNQCNLQENGRNQRRTQNGRNRPTNKQQTTTSNN